MKANDNKYYYCKYLKMNNSANVSNVTSSGKRLNVGQLLKDAYKDRVPAHEKMEGHPTRVIFTLLQNSPDELQDVVAITLRACRACGIPPNVSVIKTSLFRCAFQLYCDMKSESGAKKGEKDMDTWMQMNKLLDNTVRMLLKRAKDMLSS